MAGVGVRNGISEDDLRRIVDAIMKTAPMQWALKQMEEQQGEGGVGEEFSGGEGEGETGGEDQFSGEEPGGENMEANGGGEEGGLPADEGAEAGSGFEPGPEDGDEAAGERPGGLPEDDEMAGLTKKYGALPSMDASDAAKFAACCKRKYEAAQNRDNDDMSVEAGGWDTTKGRDKRKYEAANPPQGTTEKGGKNPGVASGKAEPRGEKPGYRRPRIGIRRRAARR